MTQHDDNDAAAGDRAQTPASLAPFELPVGGVRAVFGPGSLARLGAVAAELGGSRALIVTDAGIARAGFAARAAELLKAAGIEAAIFEGVIENPTTEGVEAAAEAAREFRADLLVGLGGGSSIDCARGANFILTNGGAMRDYWGSGKASRPMLPMIGIPTTTGTGSEAQSFALIVDAETGAKMACGDKKAMCRVAILDPELALTQPRGVSAVTGMDAISHAIESHVSRPRTMASQLFARRAWGLLVPAFLRSLESPDDLEARAAMQVGAFFAGVAIEQSMLGAAHSMANPLTARHGVVHGSAVALALPHVIRFNGPAVDDLYGELLNDVGSDLPDSLFADMNGPQSSADVLARFVEHLRGAAGLPATLGEAGASDPDIAALADDAAAQWTAKFNPAKIGVGDFRELYAKLNP